MGDTLTKLYGPAQPGTSAGNLYGPVAGSKVAVIRSIVIVNTTDVAAWLSLSVGTTAVDTAASRVLDKLEVPSASSTSHGLVLVEPVMLLLNAGEYLTGKQGTTSALTVTVNGIVTDA